MLLFISCGLYIPFYFDNRTFTLTVHPTTSSFLDYTSCKNASTQRSRLNLSSPLHRQLHVRGPGLAQAPAMHETSVNLVTGVEDVMEASERGYTQPKELPDWLGRPSTAGHLDSRDIIGPTSFNKGPGDSAEKEKFFNEELIRRIKKYLVLGAVAGVFTGIANGGAEADLWYGVSWRPLAWVTNLFLAIVCLSKTVGRAVEPLDEYPEDQEDRVSRTLSDMGDEDLQSLSIMLRRMHNRLD